MKFDHEVIIVGAGLAGLSAARNLIAAGKDVLLLEASDRVGGRVTSDIVDGYILDRGFQVINPTYPEVQAADVLKDLNFCPINPTIRVSRDRGDLILGDPRNSLKHLPTIFSSHVGTLSEKFAFGRFMVKRFNNVVSFGQASETFSGLAQHTLNPFLQGVFLTDPNSVSAEVVRQILKYFIKGVPGVPALGVKAFSEALARPVTNIRFNQVVHEVSRSRVRTDEKEFSAHRVVVATDLTTASQLLDLPTGMRMSQSTTWYHSTSEEIFASDYLVVDESAPIANSVVISKVSPAYAPTGYNLVATTTLSQISESEVRRWLSKLWRADTRNWTLVAQYRIKNSLPIHSFFPQRSFAFINGVYVVGDHVALPSQQGAMNSGKCAAVEILKSQI